MAGFTRTLVLAAVAALTGCAVAPPADPAALAARDAHAAVAGASMAAELQLDGESTAAFSQVVLQNGLVAAADAQRELATAGHVDPARRERAATAIDPAVDELREVTDTGAARLTADDLARLRAAEQNLAAAVAELGP